MEDKHINKM